jgi:hypothetical protein
MSSITPAKARFIEYLQAFNQLDPEKIPSFFYLPSTLMTPKIVAPPMTTEAAVKAVFTPFMDSLRSQGFTRSELTSLGEKALSENIVIFSGSAIRFQKKGETEMELEKLGFTYTLRRDEKDGIWKIITGIIHDFDLVIYLS